MVLIIFHVFVIWVRRNWLEKDFDLFNEHFIGFTGLYCETQIDQCQLNPCLNGGICRTLINNFKCDCPQGYTVRKIFLYAVEKILYCLHSI